MKRILLLGAVGFLAMAAAVAQLRITSFNSNGELTWINFASRGTYHVEWANSLTGHWNAFDVQTNLNSIWVMTNRVTVQVPLLCSPAFYRVVWEEPDPVGA